MNKNNRIIILGSNGFISSNIIQLFNNLGSKIIGLNRKNCNFEKSNSIKKLRDIVQPDDTIIFIAANAPVKNNEMFLSNINICKNVCEALYDNKFFHFIYISSDAVYFDSKDYLNEDSFCQPESLHGSMHYSREVMIKSSINTPISILRPTLIYGIDDPHNGYGPNSFFRKAIKNEDIILFGEGEELRDHIHISDVARYIVQATLELKHGIFNLATGNVISFYEIAEDIIKLTKSRSKIIMTQRTGKMPHNGYRAFNIDKIKKNFPSIKSKNIVSGIKMMINDI